MACSPEPSISSRGSIDFIHGACCVAPSEPCSSSPDATSNEDYSTWDDSSGGCASPAMTSVAPSIGLRTFLEQFAAESPRAPSRRLTCEFEGLLGCHQTFALTQKNDWISHHVQHLERRFPNKLLCLICNTEFDCHSMYRLTGESLFEARMMHVADHLVEAVSPVHLRTDFYMVEHLRMLGYNINNNAIDCELSAQDREPVAAGMRPEGYMPERRMDRRNRLVFDQTREDRARRRRPS